MISTFTTSTRTQTSAKVKMRKSMVLAALMFGTAVTGNIHLESETYQGLGEDDLFHPRVFSSAELKEGLHDESIQNELKEILHADGILGVNVTFRDFIDLKKKVFEGIARCKDFAPAVRISAFADGSERHTLASYTEGIGDMEPFPIEFGFSDSALDRLKQHCEDKDFTRALKSFRERVSEITGDFSRVLSKILRTKEPMLKHREKDGEDFAKLKDVLERSRHLEHFHNYLHPRPNNLSENNVSSYGAKTIDMHADQGIFIAFTPGLVVERDQSGKYVTKPNVRAEDFYIEKADSSLAKCDFTQSKAEIVIMLGDAVEHLINRDIPDDSSEHVRSVPHGMSMPTNLNSEQSRVWYGRMFLPPEDALSKLNDEVMTYGDVRKQQIEAIKNGSDGIGLGVGCSRRQLASDATDCAENTIYCWSRCMDYTNTASPDICAADNLELKCVSQQDQIADGSKHGDYNPICTNSTEPVVPDSVIAPVPQRDEAACTDYASYVAGMEKGYIKEILSNKTTLLYRYIADELDAKLIYDGKVGWMSLGIENPGGHHNGMNGAHIVMGIYDPDPNVYDPSWDLQTFKGTGVGEYIIDPSNSAFRHWQTETHNDLAEKKIDISECYSTLSFITTGRTIAGKPLVFANNTMIWAVHTTSLLKGSHGSTRGGAEKKRGFVRITGTSPTPPWSSSGITLTGLLGLISATAVSYVLV